MKTSQIKTIDLTVLEWFDKTYGNSYFAGSICINFGMKNQITIKMPFQYGYGNHAEHMAFKAIKKQLNCFTKYPENVGYWQAYEKEKIIYRHVKHENCLKRELNNI